MKMKLLGLIGSLALLATPGFVQADSWKDLSDSFTNETRVAFLSGAITLYGIDVNNGSTLVAEGTPLLDSGPLSLDLIGIHPTDAGQIGTVWPGASIHFDRLAAIFAPTFVNSIKAVAPKSAEAFFPKFIATFCPAYNFNAQPNQKALMTNFFFGLFWKIG